MIQLLLQLEFSRFVLKIMGIAFDVLVEVVDTSQQLLNLNFIVNLFVLVIRYLYLVLIMNMLPL